jgi:site-specific DNA-methyltransferase (adenine-specific)
MQNCTNKIICGDCLRVLPLLQASSVDLIFADPPFNIGYRYDGYNDKQKRETYIDWTEEWMRACSRVLKPTGSFYIAIGDEYAANVKVIADDLGLHMRNWIIWHYTFGQHTKMKFARSHTHILYFVKDSKNFTFNYAHPLVRVHSDRQLVYNDKRANPAGRMPDDVWSHFPRVCGTFKQRKEWHPCQMPELLLARIIRVSSDEGDWVLDPFSGSGTTPVVAAKLKRKYTGIEISSKYAKESRERIRKNRNLPIEGEGPKEWTEQMDRELKWLYHENNVPTGQLSVDEDRLALFTAKFNSIMANEKGYFTPNEVMKRLIRLRKSGKLGPLREKQIEPKKVKSS